MEAWFLANSIIIGKHFSITGKGDMRQLSLRLPRIVYAALFKLVLQILYADYALVSR